MMGQLTALAAGFLLDLALGDPHWLPHPVRGMGALIAFGERWLRRVFPKTPRGELLAGGLLALGVIALSTLFPWGLLWLAGQVHPLLRWALEAWFCYQLLAARSLWEESMLVARRLQVGDLPGARYMLSRIVGRDTQSLSQEGVVRAAVETVAENTSDGVIAPLLFMAVGGAPLGFFYKAVNTMDSMLGYKNERYLYFGRCAARLDDLLNLLPSRLSALCLIAAAALLGLRGGNALRVWRRDRRCHPSPNSAQTESACAGALGVELAGDACYGGVLHKKPVLGDALRPVETEDILRTNKLMLGASALALLGCLAVGCAIAPFV